MKAKLKSKLPKKLATLKSKRSQLGIVRKAEIPKTTMGGRQMKEVFYAVTIYVSRMGSKEEMIAHYKRNRDPIVFFENETEMRRAQDQALLKAFCVTTR